MAHEHGVCRLSRRHTCIESVHTVCGGVPIMELAQAHRQLVCLNALFGPVEDVKDFPPLGLERAQPAVLTTMPQPALLQPALLRTMPKGTASLIDNYALCRMLYAVCPTPYSLCSAPICATWI